MDYFVVAERRIKTVSERAIDSCGDLLKLFGYNSLSHCVYTLPSVSLWDGIKAPHNSEFKPIPQASLLHDAVHSSIVIIITKNTNTLNLKNVNQRKDRLRKRTSVTKEIHTDNVIVISSDSDDDDCQVVEPVNNRLCSRSKVYQLNPVDIATLQPGQWLNDQVINSYMQLVMDHYKNRVYIITTFFYTKLSTHGYIGVHRWLRKVKLVDYLYIMIPVNLNNTHWTLCCLDMRKCVITYFDSMGGKGISIVKRILKFFTAYFKLNRNSTFAPKTMRVNFKKHPMQRNDYDCGIFICQYARWLCDSILNDSSNIITSSIPSKRTRRKMIMELHNQSLM